MIWEQRYAWAVGPPGVDPDRQTASVVHSPPEFGAAEPPPSAGKGHRGAVLLGELPPAPDGGEHEQHADPQRPEDDRAVLRVPLQRLHRRPRSLRQSSTRSGFTSVTKRLIDSSS